MLNPWEEILLADYENHMQLDTVMQLQAMNKMMKGQLGAYSVSSVMILGIAGGNGLEHIRKNKYRRVYGIDINSSYLKEAARRYPDLAGILKCLCFDWPLEILMNKTGYNKIKTLKHLLPDGKKLVQMDFERGRGFDETLHSRSGISL